MTTTLDTLAMMIARIDDRLDKQVDAIKSLRTETTANHVVTMRAFDRIEADLRMHVREIIDSRLDMINRLAKVDVRLTKLETE